MITRLNKRTLLELTGKDAQSFLQGQFSNDINALEQGTVQLNAQQSVALVDDINKLN